MVLAQPVPAADELDAELHEELLRDGLALLAERGVTGRDVTPTLLEHFHTASGGASLRANLALVAANARLATEVAVAMATGPDGLIGRPQPSITGWSRCSSCRRSPW